MIIPYIRDTVTYTFQGEYMADTVQTILSILAVVVSGITFIYKKGKTDRETTLNIEGIKKSRLKCREDRSLLMEKIEKRLTALEKSETKHDLVILEIKKDLEQLSEKITDHHTTTQLMITQLTEHQQEMNKSLLETLRTYIK